MSEPNNTPPAAQVVLQGDLDKPDIIPLQPPEPPPVTPPAVPPPGPSQTKKKLHRAGWTPLHELKEIEG